MRRATSGFTLIELMIVIAIIGVLAAVLLPRALESRASAYIAADAGQLRTHFMWVELYRGKNRGVLPTEGGAKFVLTTWTSKVFDHTPENLDMFFTPGAQDPYWTEKREMMMRGEEPWPSIKDVRGQDTHYVGRAKEELRTAVQSADEAWMANDNEGLWNHSDGSVNVLFNGGNVRTYSYEDMKKAFNLGEFDKNSPVATFGKNSPITPCQKLTND